MKSKTRKIIVEDDQYIWSVKELDSCVVLLTIWVSGTGKRPWFKLERTFHNPWDLIGQVNEENIDRLKLEPIKPAEVSGIIKLVKNKYGLPTGKYNTLNLQVNPLGELEELKQAKT